LPPQALHRFGHRALLQRKLRSSRSRYRTTANFSRPPIARGAFICGTPDTAREALRHADRHRQARVVISPMANGWRWAKETPFEVRRTSRKTDRRSCRSATRPRVFAFTPDSNGGGHFVDGGADIIVYEIETGRSCAFRGAGGHRSAHLRSARTANSSPPRPRAGDEENEEPTKVESRRLDALSGEKRKDWEHAAKQDEEAPSSCPTTRRSSAISRHALKVGRNHRRAQHKCVCVGSSFALDAAAQDAREHQWPQGHRIRERQGITRA